MNGDDFGSKREREERGGSRVAALHGFLDVGGSSEVSKE